MNVATIEHARPAVDDTPAVYCFIDQYGARKSVLADWQNATVQEKEAAAVEAARRSRRERLKSAIAAVYHAGELKDNADLFKGAMV